MPRLTVCLGILLLLGCASRQVLTLETLRHPSAEAAPCCWQSVQDVRIDHEGEQHQLLAVMAFTEQGFSLALLDPLGRRLFSQQYKNGRLEQPYQAPLLPGHLPHQLLLALHYLSWWPIDGWQPGKPWSIEQQKKVRQIYYNNRLIVTVEYTGPPGSTSMGESLLIEHRPLDFRMTLTTKQWQAL